MENNESTKATLLYAGRAFYVKFLDESKEDLVFEYDNIARIGLCVASMKSTLVKEKINILKRSMDLDTFRRERGAQTYQGKPVSPSTVRKDLTLLGTMLRHNEQIDVACADIISDLFYDPLHGRLFDMLVALRADGDAITPLILHSTVKSDPGVIETGGQAYFDALFSAARRAGFSAAGGPARNRAVQAPRPASAYLRRQP